MQSEENSSAAGLPPVSTISEPGKSIETKWASATGLDDMMTSLAGKDPDTASTQSNSLQISTQQQMQNVFSFGDDESEAPHTTISPPVPSPAPAAAITFMPTVVTANGTLSVSAITKSDDKDFFGNSGFENIIPVTVIPKSNFGKKVVPKKSSVTRILSSTPADARFESFESVEKRTSKAVQEAEDHKVAKQLQAQDDIDNHVSGGSSRLNAIYQESESASIYRAPSTSAAASSSTYGASSLSGRSISPVGNASSTFNVATSSESHHARNKYAGNKGISSDQFFGRDEEDIEIMRSRLNKMGSANAIGSDMLSNDDAANEWQSGENRGQGQGRRSSNSDWENGYNTGAAIAAQHTAAVSAGIDHLKDSMSNLVGDIQKRLGV